MIYIDILYHRIITLTFDRIYSVGDPDTVNLLLSVMLNAAFELDFCDGNDAMDVIVSINESNQAVIVWWDDSKAPMTPIRDWDQGATDAVKRGESLELYVRVDRKEAAFFCREGERALGYPRRESDGGAFLNYWGETPVVELKEDDWLPVYMGLLVRMKG